ncbi:MAG: sulfatase-like hydrolase/transferase, partial [Candidatus Nanohaloarchaea archaeon]
RLDIFIISIDTLSANHMSLYGYPKNTTPEIDRFANDSVVFERAISQGTWTHTGIASFSHPNILL